MIVRSYEHATDYPRVDRFLLDAHRPGETFSTWLQPRWEYMFSHPFVDDLDLTRFGVTESDGRLVGIVHNEHSPAFAYLQAFPTDDDVKEALLDHAVENLGGRSITLERDVLGLYIPETDRVLEDLAAERGFVRLAEHHEPQALLDLTGPIPDDDLPDGFRVRSLADTNDYRKINRVLWRGFNHEGPPPDEEIESRKRAQRAPHFRRDLTIVTVAPNGDYASFAGIWVVPENGFAYVEPVATDPDYRRMGLGTAAVRETLRRAAAEGVEVAWVGSEQPFYRAMGFRVTFSWHLWVREME
jgi:predicted N-acetyltransferase YhbS